MTLSLEDILDRIAEADTRDEKMTQWNPPLNGDLPLRIDAQGHWYYQGSEITRQKLVALFAGVLRRESDGQHYLVTPVEKYRVEVELAALLVVRLHKLLSDSGDTTWVLETNTGDQYTLGQAHCIQWTGEEDQARPLLMLRRGLQALISRAVYYELVEEAQERSDGWYVDSAGVAVLLATKEQ